MGNPAGGGSELSKKPFLKQVASFGYIYWLANWMELVERFAYYGVRVVLPVFMVATFEKGGPQLDQVQKGNIYAVWAVVQSFVPILSGGFADRYGDVAEFAKIQRTRHTNSQPFMTLANSRIVWLG